MAGTVVLLAAWSLSGAVAHADGSWHQGTSSFDTVRGLVTSVSNSSMHVQTQSGSVAVDLSSSTGVTRIVMGSTADLAKGEQIDLHLTAPGSGVIKYIHIELNPQSRDNSSSSRHNGSRLLHERSAFTSWSEHVPWKVTGQIVAIGSSTVTVRLPHGTATYMLAGNLKVTKTMNGRIGDIGFGETVSASVNRSTGVATEVCILSS
jgi:hypothetical protein